MTSPFPRKCTKRMRIIRALWPCRHIFCLMFLAGLSACAGKIITLPEVLKSAPAWQSGEVAAGPFVLALARKGQGAPRRIYIEGDGRALISSGQPSGNPTPHNPVGLYLAMADGSEAVAYLARPCQYARNEACNDVRRWTDLRFTPEVAEAYVQAVQSLTQGQPVELVGYSGGAWVVLQVAARLPNVTSVRTVAGNLDPTYVNQLHRATPVAIAPLPQPSRLSEVPQVHYVGDADDVVPPQVAQHFAESHFCMRIVHVPVDHHTGWQERWAQLVQEELPTCTGLALR